MDMMLKLIVYLFFLSLLLGNRSQHVFVQYDIPVTI